MSHPQVRIVTVSAADAGMRLDNYLMRELKGVPKSHVYRIIRSGEVRINKGRVKPGSRLSAQDQLRIPPVRTAVRERPRPPDELIDRVQQSIVYDDGRLLALNKPAGLAVHGGSGVPFGLIEVLRHVRPEQRAELVHRIDRDTSGLLLVAANRAELPRAQTALNDDRAHKIYLAVTAGRWPDAVREVNAPLRRDVPVGGERLVQVAEGGRRAVSHFSIERRWPDATLVAVRIETGRTHQIRVHAAHAGHPLLGDDRYGDEAANRRARATGLRRMALHAWSLALPGLGSQGETLTLQAPLPPELEDFLHQLDQTSP